MNKRFKELAKQAGYRDIFDNDTKARARLEKYTELIVKECMDKYIELIVKECMDIARDVGNISDPDDFALDRCYEIEQRIQDRFGVEE